MFGAIADGLVQGKERRILRFVGCVDRLIEEET